MLLGPTLVDKERQRVEGVRKLGIGSSRSLFSISANSLTIFAVPAATSFTDDAGSHSVQSTKQDTSFVSS